MNPEEASETEGDIVTPDSERRSSGPSQEKLRRPKPAHRDPRPGFGEKANETPPRPEDLETHEEARARRAAGGAPYERESQPGDDSTDDNRR